MYTDKSDSWEGDCVCLYGLDHPTVGAWANKDCTRAFDKRPVCKRPMIKNPDTTPPGIIDEDQKEANIKYCGAPQWRWNAEFKSCYNVIDTPLPWDSQRKTCADNGGFMLDITSPSENQYVQTLGKIYYFNFVYCDYFLRWLPHKVGTETFHEKKNSKAR